MSKGFSSLLRKETAEIWQFVLPLPVLSAMILYDRLSRFAGDQSISSFEYTGYVGLAIVAAFIGFQQTHREARGDMHDFALHRPAGGAKIFGAKIIVGVAAIALGMLLPCFVPLADPSLINDSGSGADLSYLLVAIADFCGALTFYAAGLFAGSHRRRMETRIAGSLLPLLTVGILTVPSFAVAVTGTLAVAAVLVAAAWSDFMNGSDFEAYPAWGRVANLFVGVPVVTMFTIIAAMTLGWVSHNSETAADYPAVPQVLVTGSGQITPVAPGDNGARGTGVITTLPMTTDPRRTFSMRNASYRARDRFVKRIFAGVEGAPLWFYHQRLGLISVHDMDTHRLEGWIGPDGYSRGADKPTRHFAGTLQMDLVRWPRLLVLSTGVYVIRDLYHPRELFTAPPGESILAADEARQFASIPPLGEAPWGEFIGVTTDKRTYLVDTVGKVQLSAVHPATDQGRSLRIYRAPDAPAAPTFIWYEPRRAKTLDSLNHILEFRSGNTAPIEHRLAGVPYGRVFSVEEPTETLALGIRLSTVPPIVPALALYAVGRGAVTAEGAATRSVEIAVVISGLFSFLTFMACGRLGLEKKRKIAWTALAALTGPVALIIMWMFLEWPARGSLVLMPAGRPR